MTRGTGTDLTLRVFELRGRGVTQQQIADDTGVSRATVSRILSAGPPVEAGPGELTMQVEALTREVGALDAADVAKVGWLRALAAKADQLQTMRTANSGVALANLTSRFRELVAEVRPAGSEFDKLRDLLLDGLDGEAERHRGALMAIASGGLTHPGADPWPAERLRETARQALDGQEAA